MPWGACVVMEPIGVLMKSSLGRNGGAANEWSKSFSELILF